MALAKIGIYSGTFDPVHSGHLAFAQEAINELSIDLLYMLPEPTPWRKNGVTDIEHRKSMLQLVTADNPKIKTVLAGMREKHDVESTLKAITLSHPNDDLVLLMGADVFLSIDKWEGYQELINTAEFAVALRTEDDGEELVYKLQELPEVNLTKIVTNKATVASSQVRTKIAEGQIPQGLDERVMEYITSNKLYVN